MEREELLNELEKLHAAYNESSDQLSRLLDSVKKRGRTDPEMMQQIVDADKRCDDLMNQYMALYKSAYGEAKLR